MLLCFWIITTSFFIDKMCIADIYKQVWMLELSPSFFSFVCQLVTAWKMMMSIMTSWICSKKLTIWRRHLKWGRISWRFGTRTRLQACRQCISSPGPCPPAHQPLSCNSRQDDDVSAGKRSLSVYLSTTTNGEGFLFKRGWNVMRSFCKGYCGTVYTCKTVNQH